jgi:hypothetical protein
VVNRLFRAVTPLFAEISAKIALVRVQGMISLNDRLIVTRKSFLLIHTTMLDFHKALNVWHF